MIIARMVASGAPARRVVLTIVELWLALTLWMLAFRSISAAIGTPVAGSEAGEVRDLASRFASLRDPSRLWVVAGLIVSVGIVVHLMWCLRRATCGKLSR